MKSMKRVAALVMAILFVGVGVLSNVGTVSNVEAAAKISTKKKTLNQGQKLTLKVSGAKGTIKWSVNNDNVKLNKKTGKSVKVTAVKAGTSKVTAKAKGKKLTCTIKVNGLNIVKKELTVGQSFKLKATGLGKKIKWSVSNKNVTIKVSKKVNVTATAKAEGTSVITAKVGKKSYKCTVVVKHVHKTVKVPGKAATCVEPGLTDGTKCTVCNKIVVAQKEIPVLAHATIHFDAVEPGCHSLGNVEYWYCPDCEGFWTDAACTRVTNSKSVNLPAKGSENLQHVAAVEPTATENGNVEYWYCPDCEGYWLDEACTRLTNRLSVILPATGEPSIPEEGTQENPIFLTEMNASATIPAGETIWYQGRIAGMMLVAEGTGMFSVTHNDEVNETPSYWPGVEIGPLVGMGTASFAITNMAEEEQTITLTLSYPYGSSMNPAELYGLESVYTMLPAAGMMDTYEGYFYTYTPETDETVTLLVQEIEDDVEAEIDIMVSMTNDNDVVVQKSLLADGVDGVLTVELKAGVTVTFNVAAMPDMTWNRPAVNVYWGKPFGTVDNPLTLEELTTEVAVGAGESYYVQSQALAGNTLEITGGDAIVTIDGTEYNTVDGALSVEIPAAAGNFAPPTQVSIQNIGSEEATYTINVVLPVGVYENPEVVTDLSSFSADLKAAGMMDFYQGYFFKYIATEDGTISLEVKDIVSDVEGAVADIILTNNNTYANMSLSYDGVDGVVSIDVSAGDEIIINLQMLPGEDWTSPAATVTVGTPSNTNMDVEEDTDDGYGEIF